EADIAREIGSNIDPDAIFVARDALSRAIAEANTAAFAKLHDGLADDRAFAPDAASAGGRALRNVLLDYLATAEDAPGRTQAQYRSATNMTDKAAALSVLAHRFPGSDEAKAALADFEATYGHDPLVLDKWYQI